MQSQRNSGEDTEWNDVLRQKGVIPDHTKDALTEDDIVQMLEETVTEKSKQNKAFEDMTLDELDELEDEEDERILREYRQKRIQEMTAAAKLAKFGEVKEITAVDYVDEVNKAGDGIWVVLHLYKQGIPLCTLINQHLTSLAKKFPATKFLKSISTTCIPNFPDKNLPAIFVYYENNMKHQYVGPLEFGGMNLKIDVLEWMLAQTGAVETDLEEDPRLKIKDVMFSSLRSTNDEDLHENDW